MVGITKLLFEIFDSLFTLRRVSSSVGRLGKSGSFFKRNEMAGGSRLIISKVFA